MSDIPIQNQLRSILGPLEQQSPGAELKLKNQPSVTADGQTFGDVLSESIMEVNRLQTEAHDSLEKLATGENKDVHNTMIQLEKASISFKLMMEVRNKLLDAYNQVIKTSV